MSDGFTNNTAARDAQVAGPEMLHSILHLAARGWRLFPCSRAKKPLLKSWPALASSDPVTISKWAAKHRGCNWACATGECSDVFVLDVDGEQGRASLAALEAQHGPLPATLSSYTGRDDGGEHRWFAWPVDRNVRNSTNKLGAGLHIRAAGGYAIVPPSVHETGRTYRWADPNVPTAQPPDWLLESITTPRRARTPAAEIGVSMEGCRNDRLTRIGGYLRKKGSTLAEIEIVLLEQNHRRCHPPLSDDEVRTIAASVSRYQTGGPDPLQAAWQAIQGNTHRTRYEQFASLACQLQRSRPEQPVILPLERIGDLLKCSWTSVRAYRKQAVLDGLMYKVADPVPHRLATEYRVNIASVVESSTLAREVSPPTPANTHHRPTIWLGGNDEFFYEEEVEISHGVNTDSPHGGSEKNVHGGNGRVPHGGNGPAFSGISAPYCFVHRNHAVWWQRADGDLVCELCHPQVDLSRGNK